MGVVGALWRMARPGNAVMAAAGVATGASLFLGPQANWPSVGFAAASAAAGLAAGNVLNDLHDIDIDRRAHPGRPLARGDLRFETAAWACGALFLSALLLAFLANLLVLMVAGVLVVWLISYEVALKARGLIGNAWISLVVASTFVLGAAAAGAPPLTTDRAALEAALAHPRFPVPVVLSLLAFLANTAREIFKDVEDAPADAGRRRTLPLVRGERAAMRLGRVFLALAIVYAISGLLRHADLGTTAVVDGMLLAPSLLVFAGAIVQRGGGPAQRWTKWGMALALVGLFLIGLV